MLPTTVGKLASVLYTVAMQTTNQDTLNKPEAGTALRVLTVLAGLGAIALGCVGIASDAEWLQFYRSLLGGASVHVIVSLLVKGLFFISLFAAGISLLWSAAKKRRYDLIPGPTLYLLGSSVCVWGMYQLIYGKIVQAAMLIALGVVIMIFEYRSKTI